MDKILASASHCTARSGTPAPRLLATMRSIVAIWRKRIWRTWSERTWRERIRFRWDLARMAKDNPHLIDDIGLTRWQVEAEIAKRFWQK